MSYRRIRSPGKSNFLKFVLAWLLSKQQVVLLCCSAHAYLFYRDMVYFQPTSHAFLGLPVHREHPNRGLWTPIDVDYDTRGPPLTGDQNVWPIQVSSPKPIRWRSWLKQLDGALWGMPLWSLEELIEGCAFNSFYRPSRCSPPTLVHLCSLSLSSNYNTLREKLGEHISNLDGLTAPKTGDSKVDAILEVLHLEREREKVAAAAAVEEEAADKYPCELRDDTGALAMNQVEGTVDQAERSQVPVYSMDQALAILVRIATEEFGFIPRDIYKGILDLPEMRERHTEALDELDYSNIRSLIGAFICNKELDITLHRVVVVFPTENWTDSDDWEIDFKSVRIAELAAETMRSRDYQYIQRLYNDIYRPGWSSSGLVGWIFKEIICRVFCKGSTLQYLPMISNGAEPPTFLTSAGPPSLHLSAFPGGRVDTRVDFKRGLSNVTLDSNRYYIPTVTNHALFDSFTIDSTSRPVVISVFQIAASSKHEGSAEGYFHIRRLKTHVRKLLKDAGHTPPPYIKVQYFLVCPEDDSERRLEMPVGWSEGTKNTHRGDVFCIRHGVPPRPFVPFVG